MPRRNTFAAARFRGPVQFDGDLQHRGVPVSAVREFVGIISQAGAAAPEVTETIRNTLGGPLAFARDSAGRYLITIPDASRGLKLLPYNESVWNGDELVLVMVTRGSASQLELTVLSTGGDATELNVGGVPLSICMYS